MRLWLAPVTVSGTRVWFGQISRDIGVRLTRKTITTHKIDPSIDESRWYLVQDIFFSQGLRRHGWVKGVGAAPPEKPRHNYTGDPYFTDGLRAVLWMSEEPISYQHIETIVVGHAAGVFVMRRVGNLDCGGKRSATPLWDDVTHLVAARNLGVSFRLQATRCGQRAVAASLCRRTP